MRFFYIFIFAVILSPFIILCILNQKNAVICPYFILMTQKSTQILYKDTFTNEKFYVRIYEKNSISVISMAKILFFYAHWRAITHRKANK